MTFLGRMRRLGRLALLVGLTAGGFAVLLVIGLIAIAAFTGDPWVQAGTAIYLASLLCFSCRAAPYDFPVEVTFSFEHAEHVYEQKFFTTITAVRLKGE
ncbi:MAG TPA: hypothetical protein VKS60_04110 [Stellaceae bacterium]|nr:hypothetical protein [Stellaceae bacterium]